MKNKIILRYGGSRLEVNVTAKDIAEYTALCLAPSDMKGEFANQIKDALMLLDMAFDLRGRLGFDQIFGTSEYKSYLLNKLKGETDG